MDLKSLIRDVADFPEPGIIFKDITPLLADPLGLQAVVEGLTSPFVGKVDVVAGIEARGFIIGPAVALALGVGLVPFRKAGKLPAATHAQRYDLEYGTATLEVHTDAFTPDARVLVLDDVLATGGTAAAAASLVSVAGATVAGFAFLMELAFLSGRDPLGEVAVHSLITY